MLTEALIKDVPRQRCSSTPKEDCRLVSKKVSLQIILCDLILTSSGVLAKTAQSLHRLVRGRLLVQNLLVTLTQQTVWKQSPEQLQGVFLLVIIKIMGVLKSCQPITLRIDQPLYMLYVYSHDRKSFRLSGSHNGFPPLLGSDLVASDPLNGEEELGHPSLLAAASVQRHHS